MEVPTSPRGSLWERSWFGSRFSVLEFQNVPRTVVDYALICKFRKSSNLERAPRIWLYVSLNSWDSFFCHPAFYLLWHLSNIVLVTFRNGCASWLAVSEVFFLTFSTNNCQFSLVSECCHFEGKNSRTVFGTEVNFYFLIPTWRMKTG